MIYMLLRWRFFSSGSIMDPRTEIKRADYISQIIDIDDWQISSDCFVSLEESEGGSFSGLFC